MKVVLLAGGLGTRIGEESRLRPKPMVEIGGMPILWHVMKEYAHYGHTDFIICAGYLQSYVKDWFANYFIHSSDVTFDYRGGRNGLTVHRSGCEPWRVTIVDTGLNTMTGGRILRVRDYVGDETFLMTYGDAVCDVNIDQLVKFHQASGKIATLTAVRLAQTKGVLDIDENNSVRSFREKNAMDAAPINAGYMVFGPRIFDYLRDDSTILERGPLERLAAEGELKSFVFDGFWQCMDNLREKNILEKLIASGKAPWMTWR